MSEDALKFVEAHRDALLADDAVAETNARAVLLTYIERIERERDEAQEWDRRSKAALLDAGRRIAALEAENAALRADAERYRRLRANAQWMYPSSEGSDQKHAYLTVTGYGDCFHDPRAGEIVDAAIDAARGE